VVKAYFPVFEENDLIQAPPSLPPSLSLAPTLQVVVVMKNIELKHRRQRSGALKQKRTGGDYQEASGDTVDGDVEGGGGDEEELAV
jgi:hypothetical protein